MIANRADADIFANQKTNPEKRKKRDQKNGEDDPAGGRSASFTARQQLTVASRAMISRRRHRRRLLVRLKIQIRLRRTGTAKLLNRRGHSLAVGPKLIGLPGVRTRRRFLEVRWLGERLRLRLDEGLSLRRLRIRRRSGREIESAEPAKIARRVVNLSALNAFDHGLQLIVRDQAPKTST